MSELNKKKQSIVQQQPAGAPGQFEWMSAPPAPIGCPPGLEYLLAVDQILIHQMVELLEVVTGCETKNKYRVCNSMSQQVYFAQEGMLVQFHDVGYFAIYFYYQEFVAKNLGM